MPTQSRLAMATTFATDLLRMLMYTYYMHQFINILLTNQVILTIFSLFLFR